MRAYRLRHIEEALREKSHPSSQLTKTPLGTLSGEAPLASREVRISSGSPESEVDAAINPADSTNIIVGPIGLSTTMTLPIYYTTTFGTSWKKSTFQPAPYEAGVLVEGGGDPVFAFDANGKAYMSWIDLYLNPSSLDTVHTGMYWAYSTNGGQSWKRSTNGYIGNAWSIYNASAGTVDTTTGFDDKQWLAVDRSNSPYRNTLYAAWTHLDAKYFGVMLRRKLPNVDSMEPAVHVSSNAMKAVQYTSIGVDALGGVHVTFMGTPDTVNFGIYHVYSSDGGRTFQPEVKISDADIPGQSPDAKGDLIFGVRAPGNYPCPHLSIDTAVTGNLYMVWNALGVTQDEGHGTDIYFSRSTDNGKTWSPAQVVNNDSNGVNGTYTDHFYPSIAVNGKGEIAVTWYDRREDPANQVGRYYLARSTDHGQTWTNTPVASQPMDFNNVADVNGNFGIGEYTHVLTTSNYTIPVWSDGRDNAGRLRVYAAFISSASARVERLSSVDPGVELSENYPNPFSGKTQISFKLAAPSQTRLFVSDAMGKQIITLLNGKQEAGEHQLTFDGSNLSTGVYYLNLETENGIVRRAINVIR